MNKKNYISVSILVLVLIIGFVFYSAPDKNGDIMIGLEPPRVSEPVYSAKNVTHLKPLAVDSQLPFTTDGTYAYLYDMKTPLDPLTVKGYNEYIVADDNHVYIMEGLVPIKIEGLSPKNLRILNDSVLANDTQVYVGIASGYFEGEFSDAVVNPLRLRIIHDSIVGSPLFFDDSKYYFSTYRHLFSLPIQSPQLLTGSMYIKGTDKVFYSTEYIADADPASFTLVEKNRTKAIDDGYTFYYAKDKNNVYYKSKKIHGADVTSFKVFATSYYQEYAYDDRFVYFNGELIEGADPKTFTVLSTQPYEGCAKGDYGKDSQAVYFRTSKVKNADINTFESLINGYGKDASRSFYNGVEIPLTEKDIDKVTCYYG